MITLGSPASDPSSPPYPRENLRFSRYVREDEKYRVSFCFLRPIHATDDVHSDATCPGGVEKQIVFQETGEFPLGTLGRSARCFFCVEINSLGLGKSDLNDGGCDWLSMLRRTNQERG